LFGSDDEKSTKTSANDKHRIASAFAFSAASTSSWNATPTDVTKRVDWTKMRRADTSNDMSKWKDFPPIIKEFYDELPDISDMSDSDVEGLRMEKNNIVVSWFDHAIKQEFEMKNDCQLTIANPIYEFAHAFHNYPEIMHEIAKQGFTEPSPIQCQAWPIALRGQDFIGIAQVRITQTLSSILIVISFIVRQALERHWHFYCLLSFISIISRSTSTIVRVFTR
jgi:hypothetical protein